MERQSEEFDLDFENRAIALTIAGSDSGGGAGIEADLKTFGFYGVHGTVALTSVTAQNSVGVQDAQHLDPEMVARQIRSVATDFQPGAVKTGMLANGEILRTVVESLQEHDLPNLVVDPVMVSETGDPLLEEDAIRDLREQLLPLAKIITPNIHEAERLTDQTIRDIPDMEDAAEALSQEFESAVVVKGGHLDDEAVDLLSFQGQVWRIESPRIQRSTSHGSGCAYSAALTANLAMDRSISEAVERTKNFITEAIRWGVDEGEGSGCVEPGWGKFRAVRVRHLQQKLNAALQELRHLNFARFIPEVQSNFAYALEQGTFPQDVVAFPGRIVKVNEEFRILDHPQAGASSHMSQLVLEAMKHEPELRSALNIRYEEEIVRAAKAGGLEVFEHSRESEPVDVREEEGASIPFAIHRTYEKNNQSLPDIIFDRGAIGKEAMVRVLGTSPEEVVQKVKQIATNYS